MISSEETLQLIKGLHPGLFVNHILKLEHLKQNELATQIDIKPQALNAVLKAKRPMPLEMALKLEKRFGWHEGFLGQLQLFYDIKEHNRSDIKPDFTQFRRILFWDTDIDKMDWMRYKKSILERIKSRGNKEEYQYFKKFYRINEK